jgi:hypothetical protein
MEVEKGHSRMDGASRYVSRTVGGIVRNGLLVIGALTTVISIAGDYTQGSQFLRTWLIDNKNVLSALLHLVLIALVLFPGRIRMLNKEVDDVEVENCITCLNRYFLRSWNLIWVFFGLMYLVMFFGAQVRSSGQAIIWDREFMPSVLGEEILMDLFNVGSTIAIALSYVFLSPSFLRTNVREVGVALSNSDHDKLRVQRRKANNWLKWSIVQPVLIMLVLGGGVVAMRCQTLDLLVHTPHVERYLSLVLGLASAMALGYLVGRVDSLFILNWQWVIMLFYLYAAIQAFTPVMYSDEEAGKAIMSYTAFTMKCMLYIFMSDFFESKRVVYYVHELIRSGRNHV